MIIHSKMLPRRSLRIRQLNNRPTTTVIASSSSVNATSKSTGNAAKKRTHTKIMAEADASVNDVTVQPKIKKMKLYNDNIDPIAPFVLLPTEVLVRIFIKVDDIGLLNLADTCTRFESIALAVASKRYEDRYFVINSERFGGDREIYEAIFNRFGSYINAIEVNHITRIGPKHWLTKILRPHINHITKLTFDKCTHDRKNIFLRIMHKITHLEICDPHRTIEKYSLDILKCRKLVRLVIREMYGSLDGRIEQIMRNNPGLQIIFHSYLHVESFQENSILDHLDQLKEVGDLFFDGTPGIKPGGMDRIVHTLRNLESLGISLRSEIIGPLQRLGSECKQIKRLKLRPHTGFRWDDGTIEAIRSFQQIEYLHLSDVRREVEKIELAVKCLPNLRHLRFAVWNNDFPFGDILPLLREGPSLETITVSMECHAHLKFISTQFFEDFLEIIAVTGKSNARIEIEKHGKIVATMNRYGIVFRNKLIHWMGCDNIPEPSDTHLLNLAKQLVKLNVRGEQSQEHLLDRVFNYLDVTSLYLFAETSTQNKRLVENYIKMHSKQNGLFTITNEFYAFDHYDKAHQMFAPHVTNLKVYNFDLVPPWNRTGSFLGRYTLLTKASIYDEVMIGWHFPKSLRHLILDGSEFNGSSMLYGIMCVEDTVELKNAGSFNGLNGDKKHFDSYFINLQLKTFLFNYRGETQYKNLKAFFNGSKTKLVPIFPNSNIF